MSNFEWFPQKVPFVFLVLYVQFIVYYPVVKKIAAVEVEVTSSICCVVTSAVVGDRELNRFPQKVTSVFLTLYMHVNVL